MVSKSHVFYGDISRHQPASVSFGKLLGLLEQVQLQQQPLCSEAAMLRGRDVPSAALPNVFRLPNVAYADAGGHASGDGQRCDHGERRETSDPESGSSSSKSSSSSSSSSSYTSNSNRGRSSTGADSEHLADDAGNVGSCRHVYLAQQPLIGDMAALLADVPLPACLQDKDITTTNLWMCGGAVRSSLHYDPHHNLLGLAAGRKVVTVIPPYLTHCVYPMSLTGDAPNHSQVPFANHHPAASHPAYTAALAGASTVELRPGDALFIPEGWWHQVDSGPETTIAVNFWWRSSLTQLLSPPLQLPPLSSLLCTVHTPHPLAPPASPSPSELHLRTYEAAGAASTPPLRNAATRDTESLLPGIQYADVTAPCDACLKTATASSLAAGLPAALLAPQVPPPLPTMMTTKVESLMLSASRCPAAAIPGPGLRNLFLLRQLTRASVEEIADCLLASIDLRAAVLGVGPSRSESSANIHTRITAALSRDGATTTTTSTTAALGFDAAEISQAVELLTEAIRSEVAPLPSAAGAAATPRPLPPLPLPPHVVGWLLRLKPGEAATLGLRECPVGATLAVLTPDLLIAALYDMCHTSPSDVADLLMRSCRVPAVACLLTRAFDQVGTADAVLATDAARTNVGHGNGALVYRPMGQPDAAVASANVAGEDEGVAATTESAGAVPTVEMGPYDGGAEAGDGGVTPGSGSSPGTDGAVGVDVSPSKGTKRKRCVNESTASYRMLRDAKEDVNGEVVVEEYVRHRKRTTGEDGGNSSGRCDMYHGSDGGGGVTGASASVPRDFFERLYGTVPDPDKVFRTLLEGRTALNAVARRVLLEAVMS